MKKQIIIIIIIIKQTNKELFLIFILLCCHLFALGICLDTEMHQVTSSSHKVICGGHILMPKVSADFSLFFCFYRSIYHV